MEALLIISFDRKDLVSYVTHPNQREKFPELLPFLNTVLWGCLLKVVFHLWILRLRRVENCWLFWCPQDKLLMLYAQSDKHQLMKSRKLCLTLKVKILLLSLLSLWYWQSNTTILMFNYVPRLFTFNLSNEFIKLPRFALNLQFMCLNLPSRWDLGRHLCTGKHEGINYVLEEWIYRRQ